MKLIVGLGNPTPDYKNTRHNLGANAIIQMAANFSGNKDAWQDWREQGQVADLKIHNQAVKLFQPASFMNLSGDPIKKLLSFYKVSTEDLWVVHDDLDLPAGSIRLSFGRNAAGHNGVQNIIDELGTKNFWRWRLGIGKPTNAIPTDKFVLLPFTTVEKNEMINFTKEAAQKITQALEVGTDTFINSFNQ